MIHNLESHYDHFFLDMKNREFKPNDLKIVLFVRYIACLIASFFPFTKQFHAYTGLRGKKPLETINGKRGNSRKNPKHFLLFLFCFLPCRKIVPTIGSIFHLQRLSTSLSLIIDLCLFRKSKIHLSLEKSSIMQSKWLNPCINLTIFGLFVVLRLPKDVEKI